MELHAFGDASERAYGACIYLRLPLVQGYQVSLVIARTRVAPIKKLSLPRLELMSALLCARLVTFVRSALDLDHSKITCYSDSTVSLGWIKADPLKLKTFVGNRVSEIQSLVSPSNWLHCPGRYNPADLASRGMDGNELQSCKSWWTGPEWLSQYEKIPYNEGVSNKQQDEVS